MSPKESSLHTAVLTQTTLEVNLPAEEAFVYTLIKGKVQSVTFILGLQ